MTKTVEAGKEPVVDSGLVTKWFSVRAVEHEVEANDTDADGEDRKAGNGPLTLVASTGQEDRAGDVVNASGWDLAAYKANPVFLWAHDYRRPAIGKCVKVWVQEPVTSGSSSDGGRLMASIEFAPTPFAQEIRSLYAAGFMRGVSVGFRAIEMEPRTGSSGRRGVLFKRQELLEISAAPVPVNPGALVREGVSEDSGVYGTGPDAVGIGAPGIQDAKREIREFWRVLADLAGGEQKSLEADSVGDN